ncbi:MAG TPA: 30S ribosomal protein S2, partial [Acidimicrobiales bacterium]
LRAMERAGDFGNMPKREALRHSRELEKLDRNLSGIANLDRVPDAIFVIDTKKEHIAVTEANKLGLPVVAVVDTNCDPDVITHVIPGNDDAIRSGALLCRVVADAVVEGRFIAQQRPAPPSAGVPSAPAPNPAASAASEAVAPPEAAPEPPLVGAPSTPAGEPAPTPPAAASAPAPEPTTAPAAAPEPPPPPAPESPTDSTGAVDPPPAAPTTPTEEV